MYARENLRAKDDVMFFKRSNYRMPVIHSAVTDQREQQSAVLGFGFSGCVISDIGCVRFQNEDNFLLMDQINELCENYYKISTVGQKEVKSWLLAGIFDGISSTEMAEMASRKAAAAFCKAGTALQGIHSNGQAEQLLRGTFYEVNEQIAKARRGGTTATVFCANQQFFKVFQLGDSRAYLFRNGQLYQLTRDQTLAQLKLDAGLYNTYDQDIYRESHILTDYIGRDRGGYPAESDWVPIQSGDRVLLCSDGLYELCSNAQMIDILQENLSTEKQVEKMVAVAKENGGADNITCMVLLFQNSERL